MRCRLVPAALLVAGSVCLLPCSAQQVHRNSFETHQPSWAKGGADVAYEEVAHAMSDQGAHEGQRCEYLQVKAGQGSHVHYTYPTARAPVSEELNVSVWVKANRPGIQILARVVLPNERDPNSLDDRLTTLVRGDIYRGPPGRWKRLEVGRVVALARQQQQLMQAQLGRAVNFKDAYIDTVLLNVYGGQGTTEVWIDALEIGPVLEGAPAAPAGRPGGPEAPRPAARATLVEFNGTHLLVDGKRFFFRGIRHTDTPVEALRNAGFNTLFCDYSADPKMLREAAQRGFWLVPSLPVATEDMRLTSAEGVGKEVRNFPEPDRVLWWNLGTALAYEQTTVVSRSVQSLRAADPYRPYGADAWDGLTRYSGSLNLLGVHRWPLMTALELPQYRDWLEQRRRLANPGTFLWTWIQTHTPEWHANLLYDRPADKGFAEPVGPQPEQIRLLAYTAVGAGCRGLGFWSDRFLADSHQGRDRLLALALLNQELEMLDPLLMAVDSRPEWIDTSDPEIKAAVLRTPRAVLVLPMWLGKGGQYVPGQAAKSKLRLEVPQVPQCMQAWEVTPGDVRGLRFERVTRGLAVTLPEFGLTTAIVFTSEIPLIVRFQQYAWAKKQLAAQYTYEMAAAELEKVLHVQQELEKRQLVISDANGLLDDARGRMQVARQHWENGLYSEAYREAQRALRPMRILMRAQWEKATRGLDSPVASPYAVSYFTLPRHLDFMQQMQGATWGASALPGGGFEPTGTQQVPWSRQETTLDEVELTADRVREAAPKEGSQCLKLEIRPKNGEEPPALDRTFLAINSPAVKLPPGSLVKVSAWVAIPEPIRSSPDGALLYDSAGGEPLAVRLTAPTQWKQFTLYRRVPPTGLVHVTLALTGIGKVYFDDVRIEPLVGAGNAASSYPPR